jgi:hypothetical protein
MWDTLSALPGQENKKPTTRPPSVRIGSRLLDPLALPPLAGQEKSPDELAFTAHPHAGKAFEPMAFRDFRLGVEPAGKELKLRSGNAAPLNAVKEVSKECGREMMTANSHHGRAPHPSTRPHETCVADERKT